MKYRKLSLLTLCGVAFLAFRPLASAQAPEDPMPFHRHGPPNLTIVLTRSLNLSDAQQTQVRTLVAEVQPRLDAIHQQARDAAEAIVKQLNTRIRPLLTPEQQKRLDAFETLRETRPQAAAASASAAE